MSGEFEITFSVRLDGVEIGFGAAYSDDFDDALNTVHTSLQRHDWERTAGMPKPADLPHFDSRAEPTDG